jgi:hypothetical protein
VVGDRLEAKCGAWKVYYGGNVVVVRGDGTYDVRFDDGETVPAVTPAQIKGGDHGDRDDEGGGGGEGGSSSTEGHSSVNAVNMGRRVNKSLKEGAWLDTIVWDDRTPPGAPPLTDLVVVSSSDEATEDEEESTDDADQGGSEEEGGARETKMEERKRRRAERKAAKGNDDGLTYKQRYKRGDKRDKKK